MENGKQKRTQSFPFNIKTSNSYSPSIQMKSNKKQGNFSINPVKFKQIILSIELSSARKIIDL